MVFGGGTVSAENPAWLRGQGLDRITVERQVWAAEFGTGRRLAAGGRLPRPSAESKGVKG